jgi:hypothetical protein
MADNLEIQTYFHEIVNPCDDSGSPERDWNGI